MCFLPIVHTYRANVFLNSLGNSAAMPGSGQAPHYYSCACTRGGTAVNFFFFPVGVTHVFAFSLHLKTYKDHSYHSLGKRFNE